MNISDVFQFWKFQREVLSNCYRLFCAKFNTPLHPKILLMHLVKGWKRRLETSRRFGSWWRFCIYFRVSRVAQGEMQEELIDSQQQNTENSRQEYEDGSENDKRIRYLYGRAWFTHTVNVTIVSGTFGLFKILCKQHHRTALNPFLNDTKNLARSKI